MRVGHPMYRRLSLVGLYVTVTMLILFLSSMGHQYGYIGETSLIAVAGGALNAGVNDDSMWPCGCFLSGNSTLVAWWPFVDGRIVVIPLWMPLLVVGIPSVIGWLRSRRHPLGHCPSCGYNLTRNVSGVCPECGARIEPG